MIWIWLPLLAIALLWFLFMGGIGVYIICLALIDRWEMSRLRRRVRRRIEALR